MTAPYITIKSVSRVKISDEPGMDVCEVIFTSDQDLIDWEARAGGGGVGEGLLVGKANTDPIPQLWQELDDKNYTWDELDALNQTWDELDDRRIVLPNKTWNDLDTDNYTWDELDALNQTWNEFDGREVVFTITDDELTNGDKQYQINIYGKNVDREWTSYKQSY